MPATYVLCTSVPSPSSRDEAARRDMGYSDDPHVELVWLHYRRTCVLRRTSCVGKQIHERYVFGSNESIEYPRSTWKVLDSFLFCHSSLPLWKLISSRLQLHCLVDHSLHSVVFPVGRGFTSTCSHLSPFISNSAPLVTLYQPSITRCFCPSLHRFAYCTWLWLSRIRFRWRSALVLTGRLLQLRFSLSLLVPGEQHCDLFPSSSDSLSQLHFQEDSLSKNSFFLRREFLL